MVSYKDWAKNVKIPNIWIKYSGLENLQLQVAHFKLGLQVAQITPF